MTIRLLPSDIPRVWEVIKFATARADGLKEGVEIYYNKLLQDLLNDNAQCFVRIGDDRNIETIAVTRVMVDMNTGDKFLHVQSLYSWNIRAIEEWKKDFSIIKDYAKQAGCRYIDASVPNKRMREILPILGMNEYVCIHRMDI